VHNTGNCGVQVHNNGNFGFRCIRMATTGSGT
jgi:hypothetical protein